MPGLIAGPACKCLAASSTRLLAYINRATQQISLRVDALAARSPNLIPEGLVVQVTCRPQSDWGCRSPLRQVLFLYGRQIMASASVFRRRRSMWLGRTSCLRNADAALFGACTHEGAAGAE